MGVCKGSVGWHLAFVWQQQCKLSRVFGLPSKNIWERVWTLWKKSLSCVKAVPRFCSFQETKVEKQEWFWWCTTLCTTRQRGELCTTRIFRGNKWQNIIVFYSYFFLTTRNAIYEFIPWSTLFHFPETKERSRSIVIKSNFYFQSSIKKDKIKK